MLLLQAGKSETEIKFEILWVLLVFYTVTSLNAKYRNIAQLIFCTSFN